MTTTAVALGVKLPPNLEVIGLTKRFGDFVALDNVDMRVGSGQFHALLGENGAGKSTLVKCVMGYQPPTTGDIVFDDRKREFKGTREAHAVGLGMVYQQFTLVPAMTVAENLVLVRELVPRVVNWKREREEISAFIETMPFRIPVDATVSSLSAGEKQKLEILKQLYLKRRFLILDEPTSVLTPGEADEVLGFLKDMTTSKQLTVLIITHKFREVTQFADHVTILRRGKAVGSAASTSMSIAEMSNLMVGGDTLTHSAERVALPDTQVRLQIDQLSAVDGTGRALVNDLSLAIRAGEVVGIAGVSGNGQSELVQVLAGQRPRSAGAVKVDGARYEFTRKQARELRVNVLPEVPLQSACVPEMTLTENIALRKFDIPPVRYAKWFVSRAKMRTFARDLVQRYHVRASSLEAKIRTLSGGNVQRAVLSRELSEVPNVLIVQNPCFGLDFAATADIRSQLVSARNSGTAVLLVSEDLDEILELADRVCVMSGGRIVYESARAETDVTTIGRYMAGHG
jgi:simple sugar transport system ATP-binding protein